ncbi:MAG: hypothetical protein GX118_07370 [Arcobacter butzleri]|nr:hypothetical protein [Aliarcobacter butzleri]
MKYISFIYKEDDGYNAIIPDLEGCFSCGDTFEETCTKIKEAGELYCEELETLPKASTLEELLAKKDKLEIPINAIPQLIDIKVEKLRRVNIMMRADLLNMISKRLSEFNGNRSAYLQSLVLDDLKAHNLAI